MKHLILDQGLPQSAVQHLAERNIDAIHVSEIGMASAADLEILNHARSVDATIVTLDSDFHQLLAMKNAEQPSLIRIRIEGLKGSEVAKLIEQVTSTTAPEIGNGAAITVTERGIRIRKLPIA